LSQNILAVQDLVAKCKEQKRRIMQQEAAHFFSNYENLVNHLIKIWKL